MHVRLAIVLLFTLSAASFSEKSLNVAIDGLDSVQLVLRDALMGTTIETYDLQGSKFAAFVNDLNRAQHNPKLKMTTSCYDFVLKYADGKKRNFSTNGRGIGPTPAGSFMTTENLIVKYWDITKEQLCKPTDPSKKKDDFGF